RKDKVALTRTQFVKLTFSRVGNALLATRDEFALHVHPCLTKRAPPQEEIDPHVCRTLDVVDLVVKTSAR
ncbi:hypothetical protein L917_08683, partial [Phytophthora nicotianae]